MTKFVNVTLLLISMFALQACASSSLTIPEPLDSKVEKDLSFQQVSEAPELHAGKFILVGGEVLKAQGLPHGTQLEILQLPLDEWQRPIRQRTTSSGRFLALNEKFLDPATFPANTRLTIVGEVTGSQIAPLDETDYQYPTLTVKHLHIWEEEDYPPPHQQGPRWSIFGGGGTGIRTGGGVSIGIGF